MPEASSEMRRLEVSLGDRVMSDFEAFGLFCLFCVSLSKVFDLDVRKMVAFFHSLRALKRYFLIKFEGGIFFFIVHFEDL